MHSQKAISILVLLPLLLFGCSAGRTGFGKAEQLERDGNLDAALVKYSEVAAANPNVGEYRVRLLSVTEAAAKAHFKKGNAFFAQKSYDDALREYQTAYGLDPTNVQAKLQADLVLKLRNAQTYAQEGAEFEKNRKPREAMVAYQHALEFEPTNKQTRDALNRLIAGKRQKLDGYELNLKSTKPITLKFKDAKLKEVFNILSQLSGINFVFDEAVKDVNISLFLENGTFQQAMEIITGTQKLGKKVLNESTILLYPKTPDKIKQYEELFLQTFYLNKLDAKKAVNLVRTMLQVKKIYVNEELNALVIRDTPEVIEVARKILEANDVPDAEVLLDVEVFELSKKNAENFGLFLSRYAVSLAATPPSSTGSFFADSLSAVTTTPTTGSTTTAAATPSNLLNLFTYRGYNGYLTVPNATFNFGKTLSNGETLANPKIRVKNREKAKFNVGTRVPITTTSSPTGGGVSVNVQYVDVGVKVNAEPVIQLNNEVAIKLGLEVSSILSKEAVGSDKATTVVTIGTRNLDTVLSLKDGETSIIGGLIQKNKTQSKDKIFLLGDIPFLGSLFTNTNDAQDKSELLLAITPRIVRGVTVPENEVAAFWSGREDEPSSNKPYSSFAQDAELSAELPAAVAPASAGTALPSAYGPAAAAAAATDASAVVATPALPAAVIPPQPGRQVLSAPTPLFPNPPAQPQAAKPVTTEPEVPRSQLFPGPPAQAPANAMPGAPAPGTSAPAAPGQVGPMPGAPTPAAPAPGAAKPVAPVPAAPLSGAPAVGAVKKSVASPTSKVLFSLNVPSSVKLNDQFTVQVNASDVQNLYNAVFTVTFDPKKLEVVTQSEGALLKQNGAVTGLQAFTDKNKGELWMSQSRVNGAEGASGSGVLASVTFKAIGKGAVGVGLANTSFSTKAGDQIPVTAFKSIVEVK
jgi:general secretion pathway protein D